MNEEEIQRSSTKRQIARLIGNAATPFYVLGDDDRLLFANDALAELLGVESELLVGLDCSKHIPLDTTAISRIASLLAIPANANRSVAQLHPFGQPEAPSPRVCISIPLDNSSSSMVLCAIKEDHGEMEALRGIHHRNRLQESLARSVIDDATDSDLWFLCGVTPTILRTRKQIRSASQGDGGVHIHGSAPSSTLAVAKWIARKNVNASSAIRSASPIVVECRWLDLELFRATLEMIDEQSHLHRKAPEPIRVIFHQIDTLPELLIEPLGRWNPASSISLLATSAAADLISIHANHAPWGHLAANLETHVVHIPSLAHRIDDIEPLMVAWLERVAKPEENRTKYRWTQGFLDAMLAYAWPGDIEEFDNTMREACARSQGHLLTERELPGSLRTYPSHIQRPDPLPKIDLDDCLRQIERDLIQRVVAHFPRNRTAAANHLGISRAKLLRRLQQLGLESFDPSDAKDSDKPIFEEWNEPTPDNKPEPDDP